MTQDAEDLSLDGRAGLPEHLRVLADQFPRSTWEGHPHFSDLTGFWLSRHGMFRTLIARLQTASEGALSGTNPNFAAELRHYTHTLLTQLHGHHTIEDTHYFPQFMGLDDRLARGFDLLDADHHALDAHIANLADHSNAVLRKFGANDTAQPETENLLNTQRAFADFLERHLLDEEDLIVPLILKYAPDIR